VFVLCSAFENKYHEITLEKETKISFIFFSEKRMSEDRDLHKVASAVQYRERMFEVHDYNGCTFGWLHKCDLLLLAL